MGALWVFTFFIGVLSDVMSGAIRYYTSLAGAPQAIYLPKLMMAACVVLFLLISGITTDIFESLGCLLFFGVAAKSLWLNTQEQRFRLNPRVMMSLRDRKSTL